MVRTLQLFLIIFSTILPLSAAQNATRTARKTGTDTPDYVQQIQSFYKGREVRFPGSEGNRAVAQTIKRRFRGSGFAWGTIDFRSPVFKPGDTTLELSDGRTFSVRTMHPSLFRPGNFQEQEFKAPLIYLGKGTVEDLQRLEGTPLDGAIALMDFNCGRNWQRFLSLGVKGFIFIGQDHYKHAEAVNKVHGTEVAVPRFFITALNGERLKNHTRTRLQNQENPPTVKVRAEPSIWQNTILHDYWTLIPGQDPDLKNDVILITAPIDSNCVVPEMAEGANASVNLFLLMQVLEHLQKHPPKRSVLLAAVNAHTQRYQGERLLAWHLLAKSKKISDFRDTLTRRIRFQRTIAEKYNKIKLDKLSSMGFEAYKKTEEFKNTKQILKKYRTYDERIGNKRVSIKEKMVEYLNGKVNRLKHLLGKTRRRDTMGETKKKTA